MSGVKVDVRNLETALATAPPEVKQQVNDFHQDFNYGLYEKALVTLDKLATNPSLTDPQKKAVNDVIEQMKQVIAKAGAKR